MLRTFAPVMVAAVVIGATQGPARAQGNAGGINYHVLSNGFDVIYSGVGAGGTAVAGVDGLGYWLCGEDMKGTTITALGDFGYKEVAMQQHVCVLDPPLFLDFPAIVYTEMDSPTNGAIHPHDPPVFLKPGCTTAGGIVGAPPGGSVLPYGTPPGSSVSFGIVGLPSSLALPSGHCIVPNHGLLPSTLGGTATVIAAASTSLPIASSGFCWAVQFNWSPTALLGTQDQDGWWHWVTNSTFGNQYFCLSNDEMNVFQSQSVGTTNACTELVSFFACVDYTTHKLTASPNTNDALHPAGFNGSGPYYATGLGCPDSGDSINGGFDMGRHLGVSFTGTGGIRSAVTGLGCQDPAGSPLPGLVPTIGCVTWNNEDYDDDGIPGNDPTGRWRLSWLQIDWDATFGLDPARATSLLVNFGTVRVPVCCPISIPVCPQPITLSLFPIKLHDTNDQTGDPCWPDPNGFAGGSFGVPNVVGSSIHLPLTPQALCIGVPVQMSFGTSGLLGPSGPITWDQEVNETSVGRSLMLID